MLRCWAFWPKLVEGKTNNDRIAQQQFAAKKRTNKKVQRKKNHGKQNWRQRLVDRCSQYCWRQYVVILNYDWWQNREKNHAAIVYFWIKPIFLRLNLSHNKSSNSSIKSSSSDSDNARTKKAKQEKLIKYTQYTEYERESDHFYAGFMYLMRWILHPRKTNAHQKYVWHGM